MTLTAKTLAEFLSLVEGLRQNGTLDAAVSECQAAANNENRDAQLNLAFCYDEGIVVRKNAKHAFMWLKKAAMQGDATAQFMVGENYKRGITTKKTPKLAFEWYEKAALQEHVDAQTHLARCYLDGFGVEKNIEKAIHYYSLAAKQSDETSMRTLKALHNKHPLGAYHWCIIDKDYFLFIQHLKKSFETWEVMRKQSLQNRVIDQEVRDFLSKIFLSNAMTTWVKEHPLFQKETSSIHAHLACAYFDASLHSHSNEYLETANKHLEKLGELKNLDLETEPVKNILYSLDTVFTQSNDHNEKMNTLRQMTYLIQLHQGNLIHEYVKVVSIWLEMKIDRDKYQIKAELTTVTPSDLNIIMGVIQKIGENETLSPEQINIINMATQKQFITRKPCATENILQFSRLAAPGPVTDNEEKVTGRKRQYPYGNIG